MKTKILSSVALALFISIAPAGLPGVGMSHHLSAEEAAPSEKIVKSILKGNYKRVAVLPRVVSRTSGEDNAVTGKNTVGALSMAWPDDLYDALVDASVESNGKFQIVSDQQVLLALKGKDLEDVGSEEMWKVIREKTGADYLASIDVTDPGAVEGRTGAPEVKRVVNGIDLKSNSAVGRVTETYKKSLSDAAYAGESFVVREWQGNRLEATGLSGGKLFDVGSAAEKEQYAKLLPQEHPLTRKDYPYGISIEVNGEIREPRVIDGQFVVPLDMGEEYVIRAWNRGEREVFMGLYVDGVNTIGAKLEKPDETPTNRTWFLKPDQGSSKISGWQKVDATTGESSYEKFVIVGEDDSVAREENQPGGEGFGDNLGMITAMVYSYGMDDVPKTKGFAVVAKDTIGTGRGTTESGGVSGFDPNAKQKGLLLGSMTIYYRSTKWFEDHPSSDQPKPEVAENDKVDGNETADATNTTSNKPEEPQKEAANPKDSEDDLPPE